MSEAAKPSTSNTSVGTLKFSSASIQHFPDDRISLNKAFLQSNWILLFHRHSLSFPRCWQNFPHYLFASHSKCPWFSIEFWSTESCKIKFTLSAFSHLNWLPSGDARRRVWAVEVLKFMRRLLEDSNSPTFNNDDDCSYSDVKFKIFNCRKMEKLVVSG